MMLKPNESAAVNVERRDTKKGPIVALVLLVAGLAAYRSSLVGSGYFYWADERCYLPALDLVQALGHGEFREAVGHLFEADGAVPPARPGFVLLGTVPALFQQVVGQSIGLDPGSPSYYHPVFCLNLLISLAITLVVYMLGVRWSGNRWAAVGIAAVHAGMSGSNIWIRHLGPYEWSQLLGLIGLWLVSSRPQIGPAHELNLPRAGFAGILSAMAYACYPGHYMFLPIAAVVAWAGNRRSTARLMTYLGGAFIVFVTFEGFSRVVGRSYLTDLARLSRSVSMGAREEGFVFVGRYLRDAESWVGTLLLILFLGLIVRAGLRRRMDAPPEAMITIPAAAACYLFHAAMSVFFGGMVFYGRILLPLTPILVGGAVVFVRTIQRPMLRRMVTAALAIASSVSFVQFARNYSAVQYPADFLQASMQERGRSIRYPRNSLWGRLDGSGRDTAESVDPELNLVIDTHPEGSRQYVAIRTHEEAHRSQSRYIGVNLQCLGYVPETLNRFVVRPAYRLISECPHPENFPPYGYEGRRPWERRRLKEREYTMRVYERVTKLADRP